VISNLFIRRGVPEHIRSDNSPEFIAQAAQDWIAAVGSKTAYISLGSPWENGFIESFNARLRDELLDGEIFYSLHEAEIVIESWRGHDNTVRCLDWLPGSCPGGVRVRSPHGRLRNPDQLRRPCFRWCHSHRTRREADERRHMSSTFELPVVNLGDQQHGGYRTDTAERRQRRAFALSPNVLFGSDTVVWQSISASLISSSIIKYWAE
jgi:hypothetical protein